MASVNAVPVTVVDSIVQYKWLRWTVLSIEIQVVSTQVIPVVVVDSFDSIAVNGINTGSAGGCGGQC